MIEEDSVRKESKREASFLVLDRAANGILNKV